MKLARYTMVGAALVAAVNAALFAGFAAFGWYDGVVVVQNGRPLSPWVVAGVSAAVVVAAAVARSVLVVLTNRRRGRWLFLGLAVVVFVATLPSPILGLDGAGVPAVVGLVLLHVTTGAAAVVAVERGTRPTWDWGGQPYRTRTLPDDAMVVVTGATGGIGRQVALALAERGIDVVGFGRSEHKAEALRGTASALPGDVTVVTADLSSMAAAGAAARSAMDAAPAGVHGVVHAVGTLKPTSTDTAEGIDSNIASSWLSRVRVHDGLDLAPAARVVNLAGAETGSVPDRMRRPLRDPADLGRGMTAHGQAQIANDLWVAGLRRRGVAAFGYGPGAVDTDIRRELPRVVRTLLTPLFWWENRHPRDAAADVVRLLLDADLPAGGFASRDGLFAHDPFVMDAARQDDIRALADALIARALGDRSTV